MHAFPGRMRTSRAFARSLPRRPETTYPWSAAQLRPPQCPRSVDRRVIIRTAVCPVGVRQQNHKYRTTPGSLGQRPTARNQVSLPTKQIIQYFLCIHVHKVHHVYHVHEVLAESKRNAYTRAIENNEFCIAPNSSSFHWYALLN